MKERKPVGYRTCQENKYTCLNSINKKSGTYKEINIVGCKSKITIYLTCTKILIIKMDKVGY